MNEWQSIRDLREAQRSFELRKVFAPEQLGDTGSESSSIELNNDGALDAYAETVVWRLGGVHCMVSLIDHGQQYFIAGAVRRAVSTPGSDSEQVGNITAQKEWFGCSSVSTPGGLCEHTLALDCSKEEFPCFVINDLTQVPDFANLSIVDGTIAAYRFYVGTPITTDNGVNIGSLFMLDDKVRDGLKQSQKKFLHQQARNVMKQLLTKREAAERRRAVLMSKGIAGFLDKTKGFRDLDDKSSSGRPETSSSEHTIRSGSTDDSLSPAKTPAVRESFPVKSTILEKIRLTLDQAAETLRESLELKRGGVVFLDTSLANSQVEKIASEKTHLNVHEREDAEAFSAPPWTMEQSTERGNLGRHLSQGLTRSSTDKHETPKVLAASIPRSDLWEPTAPALNGQTLAALIKTYAKGNVWSIDGEGFFSSWQQVNSWERAGVYTHAERRRSLSITETHRESTEAAILSQIFPKARQIIFLPLWDTGSNKWHSGCFIWTQATVPVFTIDSELSYLLAFTNSLMVEISRLDAVTANKMKSDFIGSISHEFRSPLHGILVSAEFLRDSKLNASQKELVTTIQNCSGTLLDTINHVLDYNRINSFEIASDNEGPSSTQLYHLTNLALLCESVVDGMVAANYFDRPGSWDNSSQSSTSEIQSPIERRDRVQNASGPELILDFEQRDWNYTIEAGAVQRIVMNLLGNAQKFTAAGFIVLQLKIVGENTAHSKTPRKMLSLQIKDSGKGMSTEFMQRKLYQPFAQEDSFVPGVGLGLSIVWSIVNQINGKIKMRSELGKGTDVEVTLPVVKNDNRTEETIKPGEPLTTPDAEFLLKKVRQRAVGKSVSFSRHATTHRSPHRDLSWKCIEQYLVDWFGFESKQLHADIVVTDQYKNINIDPGQRVLIIHEDPDHVATRGGNGVVALSTPVGPFKLARSIMSLLDQECVSTETFEALERSTNTSNTGTQTPLGSPEERTILDGLITADYGFSTPATSYTSSKPAQTPNIGEKMSDRSDQSNLQELQVPSGAGIALKLPYRSGHAPKKPSTLSAPQSGCPAPQEVPLPPSPKQSAFSANVNPPSGTVSEVTKPSKSKPALHILAVDDNKLNLQLLHRYLLKRKNDVVETAVNGVDALEAVRKHGKTNPFDVIFMDISMPFMDGFEATRLIRSLERSQFRSEIGEVIAFDESDESSEQSLNTLPGIDEEPDTKVDGSQQRREDVAEQQERMEQVEGEQSEPGLGRGRAFIVALTGVASRRDRAEAERCGFDEFLTKPTSFKTIGVLLDRLSWEK